MNLGAVRMWLVRTQLARLWQPWVIILLSTAVAVGIYWQTLHYPFISDDSGYLTDNQKLAGLHLTELWRLFAEPNTTTFPAVPRPRFPLRAPPK